MTLDAAAIDEERALCAELALLRWGPTRWRCPGCSGTDGTQLQSRPRVTQCNGCPVQRSVTAGTVFAYAKLPLRVLLPAFRSGLELRTCPEIEEEFGVARSTAWHLQQRAMRVLDRAFDSVPVADPLWQHLRVGLRATGSRPLGPYADAWFQRCQKERGTWSVEVEVNVVGGLPQVGGLGPRVARPPARCVGENAEAVRGLRRFVTYVIAARRPSLRWGPRWIGALVATHSAAFPLVSPDAWLARAQALPPAPRGRAEPWMAPLPWT